MNYINYIYYIYYVYTSSFLTQYSVLSNEYVCDAHRYISCHLLSLLLLLLFIALFIFALFFSQNIFFIIICAFIDSDLASLFTFRKTLVLLNVCC